MKPLKGRLVSCAQSCQEDLMRAVFPKWKGEFSGCEAVITDEIQLDRSVLRTPLITREEINSLLVVCRNYKVFKIFLKISCHVLFLILMLSLFEIFESFISLVNAQNAHLRILLAFLLR